MTDGPHPGRLDAHPHAPSVHTRWRGVAGRWHDAEAFLRARSHAEGVHVVDDSGGPVELYLIGDPLHSTGQHAIPVFFTGAITNRDSGPGPFFSGLTIARDVGVSAIAVSDRTVTRHRDLALAWYEGCSIDSPAPGLADLLSGVQRVTGRPLVLCGGSGGGFAALQMERRLSGVATAFCWNPQTDLLRYVARTVRQYLRTCFPEVDVPEDVNADHDRLRDVLGASGVRTDCWAGDSPLSRSVLYLQNRHDWHVEAHAQPYAAAIGLDWNGDDVLQHGDVTMLLGQWGDGHAIPPREMLETALRELTQHADPRRAADALRAAFPDELGTPARVRSTRSRGDRAPTTDAPERVGVFVYGSCVARDTFEVLDPSVFGLTGYVARQSLISAAHPADASVLVGAALESRFQRRMLEGDARSSLWPTLAAAATTTDLVLCDLTDERLGVYELPDGSCLTRSIELISSGLEPQVAEGAHLIAFGTDEHFTRWRLALDTFAEWLTAAGLRDRTLFLLVPWAGTDSSGAAVAASFGTTPDEGNAAFRRYHEAVRDVFADHVVELQDSSVRTDADHRWGPAPFHYDRATYDRLVEGILRWLDRRFTTPEASTAGVRRTADTSGSAESTVGTVTASARAVGGTALVVRSDAPTGAQLAFTLFEGQDKVRTLPYDDVRVAHFSDLQPGRYRCRVYANDPVTGTRSGTTTDWVTVGAPVRAKAPGAAARGGAVFVYGSSVVRDAYELMRDRRPLAQHVSRQSLISAMSPPATTVAPEQSLTTASHQQMLYGDLTSSLPAALRVHARSTSLLLVDLLDERVGVYRLPDGAWITNSAELKRSGLLARTEHSGLIRFGTERHLDLWSRALDRFVSQLQRFGIAGRTVVIEAPFADRTVDGVPLTPFEGVPAETWNALYEPYYERVRAAGLATVTVPGPLVTSAVTHDAQADPHRYTDAAYAAVLQQITALEAEA